ncbi:methyltransferase domain-containing protein [Paenibacillus sp. UNC499MF]|uniref:methyltransferase domain-containing protein n=1 Tax=Paenibacillus sp. UNC499MF TaxID=1502751 RepID=UPI0008A08D7A|nr:methyltransferase domain-containing protein [Paenibacillus sp. UNC499MF]SEF71034.1 Methyltransferase domain-containing protein [Paenibacillus sp. UNC499MF]
MNGSESFLRTLTGFQQKFTDIAGRYDGTLHLSSELEAVIDHYSALITNEGNKEVWEQIDWQAPGPASSLAADLRKSSAHCVAIMEKYRAWKLLNGEADRTDYFRNINSCIEKEFGSFQVAADSKVLLVGSGSFPMTPLYIAEQTGAEVVGIDIDEEAVELGRGVIEKLGSGLNIRLENVSAEQLEDIQEMTHIIFSSTVVDKYDLLDQLELLTADHVIVAMRYGDGLKSLFNYPLRETDGRKWSLVETVRRTGHVFDVALYQKAKTSRR